MFVMPVEPVNRTQWRWHFEENIVAYTEFRKSYGDFEIVIPTIDFSELSDDAAKRTIKVLRKYEGGYVCLSLVNLNDKRKARNAIEAKIGKCNWSLQEYLWEHMDMLHWRPPFGMNLFNPREHAGYILRKEWCNHMANEIEREHFGHANQTT